MGIARSAVANVWAPGAPWVLASDLVADNETAGVSPRTLTLAGQSGAGVLLLSWVALRTATFTGPPTANNGNTQAQEFSQDYGPGFPTYSIRGYRTANAAGGSAHAVTVTKDTGTAEEMTFALLAVSSGSVISSSVVSRTAAGAGATLTSGNVTVSNRNALLVAVGSGTGDVNATAPTQTWPAGWTIHQSVARNSAQAPNGHVPLYLATREVAPGTHSVGVQMTINEGIVLALCVVQ